MKANVLLRRVRAYQRRRAELARLATGLTDRAEAARHERARLALLETETRGQLATFLAARKRGPWTHRVAAQIAGPGTIGPTGLWSPSIQLVSSNPETLTKLQSMAAEPQRAIGALKGMIVR